MSSFIDSITTHVRFPLRWKFAIPISMIVLSMGIVMLILVRTYVFDQLMHEVEKRGVYIARMLAERSTPHILYEDGFALQALIDSFPEADVDIAYAFMLGNDGSVLAHTFIGGFPVALMDVHPPLVKTIHTQRLQTDGGYLLDVAAPILEGRIGIARVGLYETRVRTTAIKSIRMLTLLLTLALIVGLLASLVLANLITRPVRGLIQTMQTTDLESKLPELPVHRSDEIGYLIRQFNEMVERLQQAHRSLNAAQVQMLQAQKLEAIRQLAAGVAHEIYNPLDGLRNCLEMIQKGNLPAERESLYFEMIYEAVQRIELVVRDLAEHARQRDLHWEKLELHQLLDRCFRLIRDSLEQHEIVVQREDFLEPAWMVGDELTLEQAFLNVLRNAVDAMPNGGTIVVDISQEASEGWRVEIQDTGMGIPAHQLPHLFDPFFTTKSSQRGRGLGLWVTYGILELHGGRIEVQSREFEGTTCRIFLPGKVERSEIPPSEGERHESDGSR